MQLQTKLERDTPLTQLLKCTGAMSVHQLTAYHTLMTVHRIITSQYPRYLAEKFKLKKAGDEGIFPHRHTNTIKVPNHTLTLSRGGFVVRGASLWNTLPTEMRSLTKKEKFQNKLRKWVKTNIQIRPP